jgi:hypothetical protein
VLTLPLPMACPAPCNESPFSAFTMTLYLVFRGGWPDLVYNLRSLGLGTKLGFHRHDNLLASLLILDSVLMPI